MNEENQGLDVLIDYLSFRLLMMKYELKVREDNDWEESIKKKLSNGSSVSSSTTPIQEKPIDKTEKTELSSPRLKRASKHVAKLKVKHEEGLSRVGPLENLIGFNNLRWANPKMISTFV